MASDINCGLMGTNVDLLDAVEVPIVVINRNRQVTCINHAAATALGLTPSNIGGSVGSAFPRVQNLDGLCSEVIAFGITCQEERRDGDRTFLLRIAPCTAGDGQIPGAVLTFTNITAFRASIDQAIYEREYTKAILNAVIDPLVVLDAKLQVQTANRAFYSMFGLSRDETQGVSIRSIGNNEWERCTVWSSLETIISRHIELHTIEITRESPGIGRRTLVLDARPLTHGDSLILVRFQDVTERKHAEEISGHLASIVASSDDAIVSSSPDGIITSWNESAQRIFGYTAKEAISQNIALIVPDRRKEEDAIVKRSRSGERIDQLETVRMRKDGTTIDVSLTISPVLNAAGQIIGSSKIARDITNRKRAESALRESEERFRNLAQTLDAEVQIRTSELEESNAEMRRQADQVRNLTHRLMQAQDDERRKLARELHDSTGQLLAALSMNIATVQSDQINLSEAGKRIISDSAGLVDQITREVRTISHLLHPPLLEIAGLRSAIHWYADGFAQRSTIAVEIQIRRDFPRLSAETELVIFRMVQECLTNIHRHSDSPNASIKVELQAPNIVVRVQDRGKGMRSKGGLEAPQDKVGVGLGGMKERLKQIGGNLQIESNGSGTAVIATIPYAPVPVDADARQNVA